MKEKDLIFGIRAVIEAVEAGRDIDKVFIKRDLKGELSKELISILSEYKIPIRNVPLEKINAITRKNHQGVIAFTSPITYHNLEQIIPNLYEQGINIIAIILDGLTDVRNFGAIARTCEVAGANVIIIPEQGSVSVNSDAIKTSAGALNTIPVCRVKNLNKAIIFLKNSGLKIIASTEKAAKNYTDTDMTVPTAIVVGSEDVGISTENLRQADELVKIPQFGKIKSLNVSIATGIIIYEAIRQRNL